MPLPDSAMKGSPLHAVGAQMHADANLRLLRMFLATEGSPDAHVPALVAGTDARPARQPGHQLARESLCQKTDYCRFVSCTHTSTRAPEGTAFDVPPPIRTPSPPDIHVDTGHTLAVAARPLLPCRR